jgi:hypothetical protein
MLTFPFYPFLPSRDKFVPGPPLAFYPWPPYFISRERGAWERIQGYLMDQFKIQLGRVNIIMSPYNTHRNPDGHIY